MSIVKVLVLIGPKLAKFAKINPLKVIPICFGTLKSDKHQVVRLDFGSYVIIQLVSSG